MHEKIEGENCNFPRQTLKKKQIRTAEQEWDNRLLSLYLRVEDPWLGVLNKRDRCGIIELKIYAVLRECA